MKRPSLFAAAALAFGAIALALVVIGASYFVRLFVGGHHGFRALPADRPVLVFFVNRVEIRERFVFLNVAYPGKTVRFSMHAMEPAAYARVDIGTQRGAFRAFAILDVGRAGDARCCSGTVALVRRRPAGEPGLIAVPVDVSVWGAAPNDLSGGPTLADVWFPDVTEFEVDDAEARALVARGIVGNAAIVTVDAADPERLFVAEIRAASDGRR